MTVEIAVSACPNCCLLNGVIKRLPKTRHPSHRAMVSPEEGCIERLLRYEGNYMKKHMEWNEGPTVSGGESPHIPPPVTETCLDQGKEQPAHPSR
jgi:hypothetical protein